MDSSITQEKPFVADWIGGFDSARALPIQKEALEAFRTMGFPDNKHEEWKYTSILPLLKKGLLPASISSTVDNGVHAVLRNGQFSPGQAAEAGLQIASIANELQVGNPALTSVYGQACPWRLDSLAAANTALFTDGAWLHATKGDHHVVIRQEITEGRSFQRMAMRVEAGARLTVVLHLDAAAETWLNTVTECSVAKDGILNVILVQDAPHANLYHRLSVLQEGGSLANIWTVSLDGAIIRNNLDLIFNGEHAEGHMYGLYLLDGDTHVDNHTVADHRVPNCMSNELYKGVLDGKSTGVFNGKIFVRKDAQKTNAYQSNKNILLSTTATVNTKPQLEIFADDVKCSHGTTTGRLDGNALFYLRARGLSEAGAKALLTFAFAAEVLDNLPEGALKHTLTQKLASRLGLPNQEALEI